jgi:endonuclease/exonuclease/phosphatase family metal-dependent hydrolase
MGMGGGNWGKPRLHDQAWHYLLGLGPDLAFVQEALPPSWVRSEGTVIQGPFNQWGSAIFSRRFPLERFHLPKESHLRALGTYLAFAEVSLPDGTDAFAASVHAIDEEATLAQLGSLDPTDVARSSVGRPRVNDVAFVGLEELVRERSSFIVAGDWNTARGQGSERGRKAGEEFFDRARDKGWYDCVWEKLGEEVRTWFREGDRLLQNDHVFCDRALGSRLDEVSVATSAATELGLSDHAPLILDFRLDPISMTSRAKKSS